MKNKTYIIALIIFSLGVIMLFGSSYALIIESLPSNENYKFEVANFDVEFSDNQKITISGIPESDQDGIVNSKEFSFTIYNNSEYDVNYRLDILENNNTNMSNVIRYIYAINDEQYSEILSLKDYFTIKQNQVLEAKKTDVYKIKMWLSIDADESYMNKSFSANISLIATQNDYKYATTVIEKLATNKQDGVILENGNYRYSNNQANYLWFNCKSGFTKGEDYCEKWQIIGSFLNRKENARDEYYMLKIINSNIVSNINYNNQELNGDYDNSYIKTFANGSYYDQLNDTYRNYIIKAKWNIGNTNETNYSKAIASEKQKNTYENIGLLNVSDYLFLQENSFFKNNTLFINKDNEQVNILDNNLTKGNSTNLYGFVPCVYLRPDISIISGIGTFDNPYEISIKYPMNY